MEQEYESSKEELISSELKLKIKSLKKTFFNAETNLEDFVLLKSGGQ